MHQKKFFGKKKMNPENQDLPVAAGNLKIRAD